MENYLDRITVNPDQLDGKPCIRNMRISVQTILEFLGAGDSIEEILYQYPLLQIFLPVSNMQQKFQGKNFPFKQ
jgi:uncharacterized protein (DUF433 family)